MLRICLASVTFLLLTSHVSAAGGCPDFFRFVDFGLEASDGTINRGGPTFRAEGFEGQPLLIREHTLCRDVQDVARDGHGNPIPVVTGIDYDPEATGVDLNVLKLMRADAFVAAYERSALEHRAALEDADVTRTRGANYLCAGRTDSDRVSCQVTSPFGVNFAPVVYCDPLECKMPVLAVRENVIAQVIWAPSQIASGEFTTLASEILRKIQDVHDFLAPLSS